MKARRSLTLLLAAVAISAQALAAVMTVYITPSGEKYHNYGCRYTKNGSRGIDLSEAKRKGYTPCKVCKPPL